MFKNLLRKIFGNTLETVDKKSILKFKSKHCTYRKETKIARARRLLTRERLYELYIINGDTQREIANLYNIDTKSLRTIFKSTGIKARRNGPRTQKEIRLSAKIVKRKSFLSTNISYN